MRRSRARKFQSPSSNSSLDQGPDHALLERARRHVRKGEQRRAWLVLQEACCVHSREARVWTLYAAYSRRMNRLDEAEKAFGQALYLREREHDEPRAKVLRRLLAEIRSLQHAA